LAPRTPSSAASRGGGGKRGKKKRTAISLACGSDHTLWGKEERGVGGEAKALDLACFLLYLERGGREIKLPISGLPGKRGRGEATRSSILGKKGKGEEALPLLSSNPIMRKKREKTVPIFRFERGR